MENESKPQLIEKIQPQNIEAEQATLGAILVDHQAIIKVADRLRPEDFYSTKHQTIMGAILDLYNQHEPIDIVNLSNRLIDLNSLELIGGRGYLAELANIVPTSANVVHYANIIQRKATLRRLIAYAHETIKQAYREDENIDIILDRVEQELFKVTQKYLTQNFIPIREALNEAFDRIDEIHKESGKLRGVASGFPALDHKLGGFQKSDLIILAARPSIGKTSLALDFVRNIAVNTKCSVGIFSLEMSKDQLVDRLLCAQAGVDLWKMRTGRLSDREEDDDFPRIGHAMGILSETKIFIDDSASSNIMEIRTKARRLQTEHGLDFLVIDYIQLMEGRIPTDNRVQEMTEISRSLKSLARELNIPILALSQLSRAVEMQHPPIPKLSHLRESGSIEQDSDVVLFIYREEYYKKDTAKEKIADILIAKHRNGPTGEIQLVFNKERASFSSLEARREVSELAPIT